MDIANIFQQIPQIPAVMVLDVCIKMERTVKDDHAKRVFSMLPEAEKHHLERMTSLIERKA